jgi:uncharacterized protein YdbL (DUF1318 family)
LASHLLSESKDSVGNTTCFDTFSQQYQVVSQEEGASVELSPVIPPQKILVHNEGGEYFMDVDKWLKLIPEPVHETLPS